MNRNSMLFKVLSKLFFLLPRGHGTSVYSDSMRSWLGNPEDLKPVTSKAEKKLDNSPDAVEERTRAARRSLIFPLAAILGVVLIFAIAIIVRG